MDDGPESEIYSSYVSNPEPTSSMMLLSFVLGNDPDFIIPLDAVLSLFEYTPIDTTSPIGVTIVGVDDTAATLAGHIFLQTIDHRSLQRYAARWGVRPLTPDYYADSFTIHQRDFSSIVFFQHIYKGDDTTKPRTITFLYSPPMTFWPSLHIRSIFMADAAVVCVPLIVEETPEGKPKLYESDFRQLLLRCFAAGIRWIVVAVT
eukprot:PhF_6_TR11676/c0_g1_i2/m.18897